MAEKSQILVSICCITYNHAPFIHKALDGFLMQEPPTGVSADEQWYEILIHDDASTDGTTEIIKEYAAKYPDKIYPLYEMENQYKKIGAAQIDLFNYNRARGTYIAYCEGDDYWTDSHKLQRQVDFMEAHPDYSICWHRSKQYFIESNTYNDDNGNAFIPNGAEGVDVDLSVYFLQWCTQPLTMLFRRSMFDVSWRNRYEYYRDEHEMYHLLKKGKGYLFSFIGGIYVKHSGGIYTSLSHHSQTMMGLYVAKELYEQNRDTYTKKYYESILQWLVYDNVQNLRLKCKYAFELFMLNHNIKKLIKNIIRH